MSSLIANKVKTNMCLVLDQFFIFALFYVPLFKLIPRIQQ